MKVKLMAKPQPQREWVKEYVEGRRFAYAMKPAPLGALSLFRSHDVEAIDGTRTRYRSYYQLQGWINTLVHGLLRSQIGRASCWVRVSQEVEISVGAVTL